MDRQSRKAALLQEFEREIAPARMRLAAQLPGLWQQTYGYAAQSQAAAIAATGITKAGSKRVSGAGGTGAEFKRPRTEEMERRMEPLFKECQKIIKKLHNIQVLWATWNVPCRQGVGHDWHPSSSQAQALVLQQAENAVTNSLCTRQGRVVDTGCARQQMMSSAWCAVQHPATGRWCQPG